MITDNVINAWIELNRDQLKPAEVVDSTNVQLIRELEDSRKIFFAEVSVFLKIQMYF